MGNEWMSEDGNERDSEGAAVLTSLRGAVVGLLMDLLVWLALLGPSLVEHKVHVG